MVEVVILQLDQFVELKVRFKRVAIHKSRF